MRTRGCVLAALLLAVAACGGYPSRPLAAEPAGAPVTPLVFIPGTTGTRLREAGGGPVRWGNTRSLFFPRDRGYALALPIERPPGDGTGLRPDGPILQLRLGPYRKPIYRPLLAFLERAGYVRGDLGDPRPGQNLFVFSYDWRLDHVRNAGLLARALEKLRRASGGGRLRVHLVAQSGGAHLARYLVKYGGASLESAEGAAARLDPRIEVDKLIFVGTANGGALRTLRDLDRGRRYVPLGRRFAPEVLFTFRALFQDLPVYAAELFVDAKGAPLEIDLFDADQWRNYQWSIYQPRVAARLDRLEGRHPFGDAAAREEYLRTQLARARRLHRLLGADASGFGATRYYSLQNNADPTPARALVSRSNGDWQTRYRGDRSIDADVVLRTLSTAPGDGHAVSASQQWLSPQERAALVHEPQYFEGGHFEIVLNPELQQRLLQFLRE